MRKRHQAGCVVKQRGRWRARWYENGVRQSKILGLVSEMTKSEAKEAVAQIVAGLKAKAGASASFGEFVERVYFDFYRRRWKASTRAENEQRIRNHIIEPYQNRELGSFKRDEIQDFLDSKSVALSFSVVDHLRWDWKAIFDMAVAEGLIPRNPAHLLFTPKEAKRPTRRVMTIEHVQTCFAVLAQRERLIAKLAILAGLRPGEIFGLRWDGLGANFADVRQRVYRGLVDTPKTEQSWRKAALADGLAAEIEAWRLLAVNLKGWVFPSERLTALSKDNVWRRNMLPKFKEVGLDWCNFQVMRRTHATLMRELKADPKAVADQLGHSVDVSLNVYTQSSVEVRVPLVNQLESLLLQ